MRIPPEVFQAAVSSLRSRLARGGHPDVERRSERREHLFGVALITPCCKRLERRPSAVAVADFSPTGIGIIHNEAIYAKEQFILHIDASLTALPTEDVRGLKCAVLYTVRQYRPHPDGCFTIGASFERVVEASTEQMMKRPMLDVGTALPVFERQAKGALSDTDAAHVRTLQERLKALGDKPVE